MIACLSRCSRIFRRRPIWPKKEAERRSRDIVITNEKTRTLRDPRTPQAHDHHAPASSPGLARSRVSGPPPEEPRFRRSNAPVTFRVVSRVKQSQTTTLDRTGTTLPSCGHKARHRNWWKCHSKRQALPPSRTTYHVGSAQGQLSVRDGTNEFSNPLLSTLLLSPVDTRDGGSSTPHRRPVRRGDGRCGRRSFQ